MTRALLQRLRLRADAFRADSRGSIPTEGVLAFTFLAWWYVASFQFFDAYRQKNINEKAAYTVADLISRETGFDATDPTSVKVDANYIEGLNDVFDYLTSSARPTWVRVTSVGWDENSKRYTLEWSQATGGHDALTEVEVNKQKDRIPLIPQGDTLIIVETSMAYEPIFNIGLNAQWFQEFITTSPRFASCVPWDDQTC